MRKRFCCYTSSTWKETGACSVSLAKASGNMAEEEHDLLREVDSDCLRIIVDHLMMPLRLSLKYSRSERTLPMEINCLVKSLITFIESDSELRLTWKMLMNMLHWANQVPSASDLTSVFSELNSLGLIAVPLLDHNVVLLFEKKDGEDVVIISAIDVLPHDRAIVSQVEEKPYPLYCKMAVPRRCIAVALSAVQSEAFLQQLSGLGDHLEFPARESEARKAGRTLTDCRKPNKPVYIFDWLLTTFQTLPSDSDFHFIWKSIRMESVRANSKDKPWTRSALWVSVKSTFHVALTHLYGIEKGTTLFKITMAKFCSHIVREIGSRNIETNDFHMGDIKEMCAKLARKAAKLEAVEKMSERSKCCTLFVAKTCESVMAKLDKNWKNYINEWELENTIDIESLGQKDYTRDRINPLNGARQAITSGLETTRTLENMRNQGRVRKPPPVPIAHHPISVVKGTIDLITMTLDLTRELERSRESRRDVERTLYSIETFVRLRLWPSKDNITLRTESSIEALCQLLSVYASSAKSHSTDYPISLSRMVLYCCTMMAVIDHLTVLWDPLEIVGKHRAHFMDPSHFGSLLLMHASEHALLQELLLVIQLRTSRNLSPGILAVCERSLPERYAAENISMVRYEADYQEQVSSLEKRKMLEVETAKNEYESIQRKISTMTCECKKVEDYRGRYRQITCTRCCLRDSLNENSVYIYERELPDNVIQRRCVVFYRLIPPVLRYYRDGCALIISLFGSSRGSRPINVISWDNVGSYLGSTTKAFTCTHYNRPSILTSSRNFIVPQGKNVNSLVNGSFADDSGENKWNISEYCRHILTNSYSVLQFAVDGVGHTENKVIALQCKCPTDIELAEFKDFGTLRAGGYLQWRNIAVALECGILNLNDDSVVKLIQQSCYQVGPTPSNEHWNQDLLSPSFVASICKQIELVLERINQSWKSFRSLFLCLAILCYVIEHSPAELSTSPVAMMLACREVAKRWSLRLETAVALSHDCKVARFLYCVNSLILISYGVFDQTDVTRQLLHSDSQDKLFDYIRAMSIMFEQQSVHNDTETKFLCGLTGRISAHLELEILSMLRDSNRILEKVATDRWNPLDVGAWVQCKNKAYCFYESECVAQDGSTSTVQLDVIHGTFLVDGEPVGILPIRITEHPLFQRVFGVMQIPVFHRGGGVFETKEELCGASYTFALVEGTNLIVREICLSNCRRLMDASTFQDDLPDTLVKEFSHWLSLGRERSNIDVEIRNIMVTSEKFRDSSFLIKLNQSLKGEVLNIISNRPLLNWTGELFNGLHSTFLRRLDLKDHIIPYLPVPGDDWILCLYFVRHNLHLEIRITDSKTCVHVREFENYTVSSLQSVGTFFGFEAMLVLQESNFSSRKVVIVPNLSYRSTFASRHHATSPSSWELLDKNITYFAFVTDQFICQMRPNGSEAYTSWLMCSLLHAMTCSAMPEPLTGLTGLEMAVTQLRRCFSNRAFDDLGNRILRSIEKLSVKRKPEYDICLETWDSNRSAYSSADVYKLIVSLLRLKSEFLFKDEQQTKLQLVQNAYAKYFWVYSPDARLRDEEENALSLTRSRKPSCKTVQKLAVEDFSHRATNVILHMATCKTRLKHAMQQWRSFSWATFFGGFGLVEGRDGDLAGTNVGQWSTMDFKGGSIWFSLYLLALASASGKTSSTDSQQFLYLLSFVAWTLKVTVENMAEFGQLVLMSISRGRESALPIPNLFLGKSVSEPSSRFFRCKDFTFINHFSEGYREKLYDMYYWRSTEIDNSIWGKLELKPVWEYDSSSCKKIAVRCATSSSFEDITYALPVTASHSERMEVSSRANTYYETLLLRQDFYLFLCKIDEWIRANAEEIVRSLKTECPCFSLSSELKCLAAPWHAITEILRSARSSSLRPTTTGNGLQPVQNGRCDELEALFSSCVVASGTYTVDVRPPLPLSYADHDDEIMNGAMGRDFLEQLQNSWDAFHSKSQRSAGSSVTRETSDILMNCRNLAKSSAALAWETLKIIFEPEENESGTRAMAAAGVLRNIVPRTYLRTYLKGKNVETEEVFKYLELYLVYTVYAQKADRCLRMLEVLTSLTGEDSMHYSLRVARELQELHCDGWSPQEFPSWLLFEVEGDVLIRRVQSLVTRSILDGTSNLLQLNMGEGKTSVISPLICLTIADHQRVVRLTLLTSLIDTHGQELAMRLGGLLEQPVYYFPCKRDMPFGSGFIRRMSQQLLNCVNERGCIIAAPEHRLSLLLKFEELSIRAVNNGSVPSEVGDLYHLFGLYKKHVVDVLDESDEVLKHKYQLLYTIGSQQAVDGNERRWKVLQEVLGVLDSCSDQLLVAVGEDCVTLHRHSLTKPGSWPSFRIIKSSVFVPLRELVVQHILSNKSVGLSHLASVPSEISQHLEAYLLGHPDENGSHFASLKLYMSRQAWQDILILRGLLSYDVLQHALTKRWTVEYGVDRITKRRLMAIPFKAKDMPSERTDFGHPDIALVLTHISYYYSGLDEAQMNQAFERLEVCAQRDIEYQTWIDRSGNSGNIGIIVKNASAINTDDPTLMAAMCEFFKFNTATINFWLNACVLPKETKQFPFKLVASAWDLAKDQSHPVKGFSGTKDGCKLLPLGLSLGYVQELETTDGEVLTRITAEENQNVHQLDGADTDGIEILDYMISGGEEGSVLIDVGALMIGMDNATVAKEWLLRAPSQFVGAAYFEGNHLMVRNRDGQTTPLAASPLKQSLWKLLVYMDDIHTRGTDFRFPIPTRAFVTLGRNLQKDKLVQACMRMRQLGQGHSICFLAPKDVYSEIRQRMRNENIQSPDVIGWALHNTVQQLRSGLLEWAQQGLIFSRREAAESLIATEDPVEPSTEAGVLQAYTDLVKIEEVTLLTDFYEPVRTTELAITVVRSLEHRHAKALLKIDASVPDARTFIDNSKTQMKKVADGVTSRCEKFLGEMTVSAKWVDEEQERELEDELEEERQVERPGSENPLVPTFPTGLLGLVYAEPASQSFREQLIPVWEALKATSAYPYFNSVQLDNRVVTTFNFRRTLRDTLESEDEFVRPPRWLLVVWDEDSFKEGILVSPFEANRLMREIRKVGSKRCSLHRFAPRVRRDQSELLTSGLTQWSQEVTPTETVKKELHEVVMLMSAFGASTCLTSNDAKRSIVNTCLYLGLFPSPAVNSMSISPEDWRILMDKNLLGMDGFVLPGQEEHPEGLSDNCWALFLAIKNETKLTRSPVLAIQAVVPLRNMNSYFVRSDLNVLLRN